LRSSSYRQISRMKVAIVLFTCLAVASAQQIFQQRRFQPPQQPSRVEVDDRSWGSEYHYSWRHDGNRKYTGEQAAQYCRGLGGGWQPISIESSEENDFVSIVILSEGLSYIWTGATLSGSGWNWPSGAQFNGIAWSHTGFLKRPQPDSADYRGENCLGILDNFYNDGVKWHDIGCHNLKPVICERRG